MAHTHSRVLTLASPPLRCAPRSAGRYRTSQQCAPHGGKGHIPRRVSPPGDMCTGSPDRVSKSRCIFCELCLTFEQRRGGRLNARGARSSPNLPTFDALKNVCFHFTHFRPIDIIKTEKYHQGIASVQSLSLFFLFFFGKKKPQSETSTQLP